MPQIESRLVNVIETRQGESITYFTLEGLMIGGFKGGARVEPSEPEHKVDKPAGGVVLPPTPQQVQKQKDRENEELLTAEGRLKHLNEDVPRDS